MFQPGLESNQPVGDEVKPKAPRSERIVSSAAKLQFTTHHSDFKNFYWIGAVVTIDYDGVECFNGKRYVSELLRVKVLRAFPI